ncbi:hypothetical protein COPCOM_02655 [Coprococcus comes ATCC 27758]|uniref:Uncharacterized protein n=1 Tax=Coprococcus comes ATCC 27758 TaxID=470146 RepID=C0BA28_9FIRM|nr:hypothetical protein COPCOM_02655 [Coprococcus comes ATCC 27758]
MLKSNSQNSYPRSHTRQTNHKRSQLLFGSVADKQPAPSGPHQSTPPEPRSQQKYQPKKQTKKDDEIDQNFNVQILALFIFVV